MYINLVSIIENSIKLDIKEKKLRQKICRSKMLFLFLLVIQYFIYIFFRFGLPIS